jgi:hypothetical protein
MLRWNCVAGGARSPFFNTSLISRQRRSVIKVCCLFAMSWSRRIRCVSRAVYVALFGTEQEDLQQMWYQNESSPSSFQTSFCLSLSLSLTVSDCLTIYTSKFNHIHRYWWYWRATGEHFICSKPLSSFLGQLYSEELFVVRDLWKMHKFSEAYL